VIAYESPVDIKELPLAELLSRCANRNDVASWEEFIRRFHGTIAGCVCKAMRGSPQFDSALVEDLVQDSLLRLCQDGCRPLKDFRAEDDACFFGLLRAAAASAVADHFRRANALKRRGNVGVISIDSMSHDEIASPGSEIGREYSFTVDEIERILAEGDPVTVRRNQFIFWTHFRDGFSAREIASIPSVGLGPKGVETVIRRLKQQLLDRGLGATAGRK
jgi:DNA-directed RNA polymerase specialized sigma24 family protein